MQAAPRQRGYHDDHDVRSAMRPLVIGIAGGTGSGKTTVARKIAESLPADRAVVIQHDWYYLDRSHLTAEARANINFDEPDALDNAPLLSDLLALKDGRMASCPQYDFTSHTRLRAARDVAPHPIVIVEGILLFAITILRDAF